MAEPTASQEAWSKRYATLNLIFGYSDWILLVIISDFSSLNSASQTPKSSTSPCYPGKTPLDPEATLGDLFAGCRPVIQSYSPQRDDELELVVGDVIVLQSAFRDGWGLGTNERTGTMGALPLVCLGFDEAEVPPWLQRLFVCNPMFHVDLQRGEAQKHIDNVLGFA